VPRFHTLWGFARVI